MDALLFMVLALILTVRSVYGVNENTVEEVIEEQPVSADRQTKLNDTFTSEPEAFSEIIHALGFPKER